MAKTSGRAGQGGARDDADARVAGATANRAAGPVLFPPSGDGALSAALDWLAGVPRGRDVALDLAPSALAALEDGAVRSGLRAALAARNLRAVSGVGADGLPDWTRPHRAAHLVGLAELLADLNPQRTVICLPVAVDPQTEAAARYVWRAAAFCQDLRVQTRRSVRLALAGPDLGPFLTMLYGAEGVRQVAGLAAMDRAAAEAALPDLIGVCDSGTAPMGAPVHMAVAGCDAPPGALMVEGLDLPD